MSPSQPNLAIPYPGLRPFDEADHLLFFGRNEQVNELLMRLEDSAFVAVVGSSGSGKSSLVLAGLLPLLHDGFLFGTDNWKIAVAKPVDEPYQRLAHKLTVFRDDVTEAEVLRLLRCSDDGLIQAVDAVCDDSEAHVLVVIDQFEELFGFRRAGDSQQQPQNCASRDEAAAFVAMLLAAARKGGDRLRIMITMRSDFVGDCEVFLGLPQAVSQSQFLVPRLTRSQMEEAITCPSQIRHAGFETFDFEPGLITTLTNDAGDRPDQLPLLQHALMRTWKLSDKKYLTAADYAKAGRIEKALSNDADGAWESLNDDNKQLARQMFLLLCDVSQEGQMTRRRPRAQEVMDVAQVGCADIESVVRVFQDEDRNFLLPPGPETISPDTLLDISHESLLRQWDRLRDWLKAEQKSAKEYLHLADRAQLWKTDDDLLRGSELDRALEWKEENPKPTPAWAERYHPSFADTMQFLQESKEACAKQQTREAEAQKARRAQKRRSRKIAVALFVVLLVIPILTGTTIWAIRKADIAKEENTNALWQAGIAHRAMKSSLTAARTFLLAAESSSDETQQRNFELAAQFAMAGLIRSFPHDDKVKGARFNNNQTRVLSWDGNGAVRLWDVDLTKAEPLQVWKHDYFPVEGAIFSPDGSHVLSWDGNGALKLWDAVANAAEPLQVWKHDYAVSDAIFSPDGSHVLSWDASGAVKLWDAVANAAEPLQVWKHDYPVSGATFSPDGSDVLSWDATSTSRDETGTVKLWDIKAAKPTQSWKHINADGKGVAVKGAVFAGGPYVLSWSDDDVMNMWDINKDESFKKFKGVPAPSFASDSSGDISKDGRLRYSTTTKKVVELWKPDQESPQREWNPDTPVSKAIFTRDGSRVITWNDKGALKLWDTTNPAGSPPKEWNNVDVGKKSVPIRGARLSPDGSRVLYWDGSGAVKLWDVKDGQPSVWKKDNTFFLGAIFSPDGSRVLSWDRNGALKLWDVKDGQHSVWDDDTFILGAIFTPDGSGVLTWGDYDDALKLWDVKDGKPSVWKKDTIILGAIFTPDGSGVLTWDYEGTLKLWDVKADGSPKKVWKAGTKITGATFSPDASHVLSWDANGAVKLWDANAKAAKPLQVWKHINADGDGIPVTGAIFTHDGLRTLTWDSDGVMKMWPLDRSESIKEWKNVEDNNKPFLITSAQFTKDDASILMCCSNNGTLLSWDAAFRYEGLKREQRFLELQVRSATKLTEAGELVVPLSFEEWMKRTDEYEKIKPKQQKK